MTTPPTYASLDDLLRFLGLAGEHGQVECKASAWQLHGHLGDGLGLANTNGGILLLGIAERGGRFEVAGLVDAVKTQHDLVSGLREMLNVPVAAQVEPLVVNVSDAERVLLWAAYIPEAIAYQKPVYIRSQGLDKGCYNRVGGHDMPCTEDDLARFFQDRALIDPDMLPVPMAQRAELDAGQIRAFRQLVATQNPASSVLGYDDDDLLRAYGALSQPKGETGWLPTVAGVLMFGTPALIQRCSPAFRVDLIEVEGTEWVTSAHRAGPAAASRGRCWRSARGKRCGSCGKRSPNALRSAPAKRSAWPIRCTWRSARRSTMP